MIVHNWSLIQWKVTWYILIQLKITFLLSTYTYVCLSWNTKDYWSGTGTYGLGRHWPPVTAAWCDWLQRGGGAMGLRKGNIWQGKRGVVLYGGRKGRGRGRTQVNNEHKPSTTKDLYVCNQTFQTTPIFSL